MAAILLALLVATPFFPASAQQTVTQEQDTNRFGADYRGLDLPREL